MAFEQGTGGTAGGSLPPGYNYGGGVGGGVPGGLPNLISAGTVNFGGFSNTSPLIQHLLAPVTTTPDYNALLGQAMQPYQDAYNAQQAAYSRYMSALQDQISHQEGFAREAYGINKSSDQAAYDQYIKQLIATLVGRGLGNSGARNYYTRIRSEALNRQLALLRNQLNSYIYGLQSQLTNARLQGESQMAAGQGQLAAARQSIGMSLPSQFPATTTPAPRLFW